MQLKSLAALAVAMASIALAAPQPAEAGGRHSYFFIDAPYPGGPDPYAYRYVRPGYYPYYDSRYWVPRREMRYRTRYPLREGEYWSSWGYPLTCKVLLRGKKCGVPYRPARRWIGH
ncbi:MAG: hypothetical protein AB7G35_04830 [Hyphomicrobiaceae bacterium]